VFQVEYYWGFAEGSYKTNTSDLKRGDPVTTSGSPAVVVRASNATAKSEVYLVDYARTAKDPKLTYADYENVPTDTYLTLYNINEGVFTLDQEHFAAKPSVKDQLEITSAGKLQTRTTGTAVAKVINVEGTATEYKVTIRPAY